jgi:ABC-type sugar transport system substrate-binding protein
MVLLLVGVLPLAAADKKVLNPGVVDVGYSVPDTTNPFVGWLTQAVKKLATDEGYNVQIADAGGSSSKQMEQLENFIAMKVKVIDLMPVDPNNVQDIITRAQKQGIKVLVAGADTGVYDMMMNMDQNNCGKQIAEMGIDWITKTFTKDGKDTSLPTGDKKLKVLVIKYTSTIDGKNRSEGILQKLYAWGKVNVVVATAESMTTAGATAIMENMWQQNSDAVATFCYNADDALGVNEYIMAQNKVDKGRFAVYAGDWSPPIQEVLNQSLTNKSVFRGTMQIVGPSLNGKPAPLEVATWTFLKALYQGDTSYGKWSKDSIAKAFPATK